MRIVWLFEVSESSLRGYWKQFLIISSLWTKSIFACGGERGTIYLGVKCPPAPQSSCMLSFLCNDKRSWEEPGHLKFLNAFQEDTGNSFSYLVPMHTVRIYLSQVSVSHQSVELRRNFPPNSWGEADSLTQCPIKQSSWGGLSNPGYSVPPNSPAKGDTLTQATVSPLQLS